MCLCCGGTVNAEPATVAPFVQQRTGAAHDTRTLTCPSCGFVSSELRLTDTQMSTLYAGYRDAAYTAQREACEPGYTARYGNLNHVRDYIGDVELMVRRHAGGHIMRVLDIGGNDGANAPFLGIAAVDVWDISDVVTIKGVRRVDGPDGSYELAVLAHVLEHAPDPERLLRIAAGVARMVYIEVPAEPVPTVWHEHCNNFTASALRALAYRVGLQVVEVDVRSTDQGSVLMAVAK